MIDWRKLLTDEHLWDYRCKAVPVPLVREIVEEVETLRQDLAAARALPTAMANGYTSGSVTEHEFHSIHLHYNTRQQAVAAFEAISDAIDAALAERQT